MATIYDVARHAGVSAATVSRVLNGRRTVDPALADRVMAAAAELRYRRNAVARNLRQQRTNLWAVIVSDVENPFFTSMVRGVEDVGSAAGYSVVLCNSDENPEKESGYIAVALSEQMAGVIISPSSNRVDDVNLLLDSGCPVVVVDRELAGVQADIVQVDNAHGAEVATRHLLDQGYQRIACITGPRHLSTAVQRLDGYRRALVAAGREVDDSLVRYADFRRRGGHDAMASLLEDGGTRGGGTGGRGTGGGSSDRARRPGPGASGTRDRAQRPGPGDGGTGDRARRTGPGDGGTRGGARRPGLAAPDAVFVGNNLMTVGVLECLVERGLAVPAEVAVVGFDEIPWADLVRPAITTVAQPTYQEGRVAAELLVQRLAEPGRAPSRVVLETTLHVRDSSTR